MTQEPKGILIVDDDQDMRELLERRLRRWDLDVVSAENGVDALEVLEREGIQLMITDWMMPEMDGLELCRAIRSRAFSRYIYIILLTGKAERHELVEGIEAGADDFIVKPFKKEELHVRIRAGMRMIQFERQKETAIQALRKKNLELEQAGATIRAHLEAAGKLQQAMLPLDVEHLGGVHFESLFVPCEYVAGDMFNYFELSDTKIAFFLLDVAGHGVPAAMQSVTISKVMNPLTLRARKAPTESSGEVKTRLLNFQDPAELAASLNRMFMGPKTGTQYFTMIYGVIDTEKNRVQFVQAGHPSLILLKSDGELKAIGEGGYPIGLLPKATYFAIELDVAPGDRIFIHSDGITDCRDANRKSFGFERLHEILSAKRQCSMRETLETIHRELISWTESATLEDDLSIVAMEFK